MVFHFSKTNRFYYFYCCCCWFCCCCAAVAASYISCCFCCCRYHIIIVNGINETVIWSTDTRYSFPSFARLDKSANWAISPEDVRLHYCPWFTFSENRSKRADLQFSYSLSWCPHHNSVENGKGTGCLWRSALLKSDYINCALVKAAWPSADMIHTSTMRLAGLENRPRALAQHTPALDQ